MRKTNKPATKQKTMAIIVGIIVFAATFYGAGQFFKKDLESELKDAAIQLNRQTPMKIDEYTRLDSASAKGRTNFIYYYTLVDREKSEVNPDTVNKYIRPGIIEGVKNNPGLKVYRDNKITMDYRYYDKNGTFVLEISVPPSLYTEE